jgi:hypothetical protein
MWLGLVSLKFLTRREMRASGEGAYRAKFCAGSLSPGART